MSGTKMNSKYKQEEGNVCNWVLTSVYFLLSIDIYKRKHPINSKRE